MFRLTKRKKFVLGSLLLTGGLLSIQLGSFSNRYLAIGVWSVATVPLFLWSLAGGLSGWLWLLVWILPFLMSLGMGFFYFLLPLGVLSALPVILLYLAGIYALFLSENIFTVASIRTIQLYRSASSVTFLITLFTGFLLFDNILSFRLPFYWNFLLTMFFSWFLFFHFLWTIELKEKVSRRIFDYSLVFSLLLGELSLALSFWPTSIALKSLLLTSGMYIFLGLTQAEWSEKFFKSTVREYLVVGFLVLIILLLYTRWG